MKHHGGCHCGRIGFEVEGDFTEATACNCSICSKRGHLLAFVPATQFALTTPDADAATYMFNKHAIRHRFCPVCGVAPFANGEHDGVAMVAVNLRCVDGIDPASLTIRAFDGRSL
jgi:hypothetical protein